MTPVAEILCGVRRRGRPFPDMSGQHRKDSAGAQFFMTLFAGVLAATFAPALAQGDSAHSGEMGHQIPANASCGQMKQMVLSVHGGSTSTPIVEATTGKPNPNESGNTERTTVARHEIAAGDAACESGDRAGAHAYYQRAIEQLTASR